MSAGVTTMSDRDRLSEACALLRRYGICATGGLTGEPAEVRRRLARAVLERFPDGACSFVFWTAEAADAFDPEGNIVRPLLLHYNGPPVARAVRAALAEHRLGTTEGPEPLTLLVQPRSTP